MLNLEFCGFSDYRVTDMFTLQNQKISHYYNLNYWEQFELQNPSIFKNMYQFWCQKDKNLSHI